MGSTQCLHCLCFYNYILIVSSNYRNSRAHYKSPISEGLVMKGVEPAATASINTQGSRRLSWRCWRKCPCPRGRELAGRVQRGGCLCEAQSPGRSRCRTRQEPGGSRPGGRGESGSETPRGRVPATYLQVALQDRGCAPGAGLPSARAPARGGAGAGRGRAAAVSLGLRYMDAESIGVTGRRGETKVGGGQGRGEKRGVTWPRKPFHPSPLPWVPPALLSTRPAINPSHPLACTGCSGHIRSPPGSGPSQGKLAGLQCPGCLPVEEFHSPGHAKNNRHAVPQFVPRKRYALPFWRLVLEK